MSKIVIFNGSPRKKGICSQVLNEMIQGAEEKGNEVTYFNLNDKGVRGCQSCFYCRKHEGCATKDDLQPMYEAIKEADAIVFSSPIYMSRITGQAKLWIDRLYPFINNQFQPRNPGKKVFALYVQGAFDDTMYQSEVDTMEEVFKKFGWEVVENMIVSNTSSPEFVLSDDIKAKARQIGAEL
ncbi:MAG: flavodoxin family protein [Bacillota bacterium]|nr:flavodoxin family protein [Bacillota bacterium]